jgi:hypothetical protein
MLRKATGISFCLVLLLAAFPREIGAADRPDQSIYPWSIEVLGVSEKAELSGKSEEVQYDGKLSTRKVEKKAPKGEVFVILELRLKKQAAGSVFSWNELHIESADGKRYGRLPDDAFLELFGMRRIRGTDLNFGEHEGSICFSLPIRAASGKLLLVHETGSVRDAIRIR